MREARSRPAALAVVAVLAAALVACGPPTADRGAAIPSADTATNEPAADRPETGYVGSEACRDCHADQYAAWQSSDHDLALARATPATVLGDFDSAMFEHAGVETRFYRRGDDYFVETDGEDGALAEFPVVYTFGVSPLQQYLLDTGRGRLQALSIAWDTRPADAGGQRWFHLYGDDPVPAGDALHWTGRLQNWNTMCADCHSTGVHKGYDVATDSYATTFAVEDVGCEACHGPGAGHAAAPRTIRLPLPAVARAWTFGAGARIASRQGETPPEPEVDTCAQCHSRRGQLGDKAPHAAFLDDYRPERLSRGPYYDDGQVREEVYVYGSFLQSRMYAAGVTCSDCHEPHSLGLRADRDAVCSRCHAPEAFATAAHRHHAEDGADSERGADPERSARVKRTAAAAVEPAAETTSGDAPPGPRSPGCIDCHMRAATFMQVDRRRDHSFRVPRPDLTVKIGSPNACNDCHADRSAEWAAATVADWFPDGRGAEPHFGTAFAAVRDWRADPVTALGPWLEPDRTSPIVRATAVATLGAAIGETDSQTLARLGADPSPLVRLALIDAARDLPPERRVDVVQRYLSDAPRSMRIAAALALLPVRDSLGPGRQADFAAALAEAGAAARFGSDRPEGLVADAELDFAEGNVESARNRLGTAIDRFPWFAAAYVNLADIERANGRDAEALDAVEAGLAAVPDDASLEVAHGLALVRLGRLDEAIAALERARTLAPDAPYEAYLYGLALESAGDRAGALAALAAAGERFPAYADIWFALATLNRDADDRDAAIGFARRGRSEVPSDPRFRALLAELGAG